MAPGQEGDDETVLMVVHKAKVSPPLFTVPNLFVALTSKVTMPDSCEPSRSPTSTLDHKPFKVWGSGESGKVGLGLVNSLTDETKSNIVFGSRLRTSIPAPTTCLINCLRGGFHVGSDPKPGIGGSKNPEFEIGEFGKMGSLPIYMDSSRDLFGSMSASDIELSEDYTCIISHGPNPKTTHIFGDTIIESLSVPFPHPVKKNVEEGEEGRVLSWVVKCSGLSSSHCSSGDINMCRSEKASCCSKCHEVFSEKEAKKPVAECTISPEWNFLDEIFRDETADAL